MTPGPTASNEVRLAGKISRMGRLKYTPSGIPVLEFTIAVSQRYFDKESVGYFEVLSVGDGAENMAHKLRIGESLSLKGSLWVRTYRNRQGAKVSETKVLLASIGGDDEEDRRKRGS